MKKVVVEIHNWSRIYNNLADMIGRVPEKGNLRYIRHLANLKLAIREKGNGLHKFTEKQAFAIKMAEEGEV
jgi:hypothetical protein